MRDPAISYEHRVPVAMSIGASDPLGRGGIQADLKTFSALGVHGTCAITSLCPESGDTVSAALQVSAQDIVRQLDAVLKASDADCVKVGELGTEEAIQQVARYLRSAGVKALVVDPCLIDTRGREQPPLLISQLKQSLLSACHVVTPSVREAELLLGSSLDTWEEIREAAREMHGWGCANVVITRAKEDEIFSLDLLFDGEDFRELSAQKVAEPVAGGKGGAFAAALAATLAKGDNVATAAAAAKAYVTKALQEAFSLGASGPAFHHFYRYWRPHIRLVREGQ